MSVQDYELLLRVRADLNQALGGLDNLKRKLGEGEQGATRMAQSGDKAVSTMRVLGSAIAAVGIAKLVKDYFAAADAASNMAAKVRLVTDSTAAQVAAQKQLFAISQQTSSDLGTTTELYVKLAQSSDVLRNNQTLLVGTTKLVNQALVLSGADAGTASGVVRQFAQAMASGVLRGDEFNSIMEGAPRLARAMADGLGVPQGALRSMAAQGELTADKVISALTKQGDVIDREFGTMPLTVGRAVQQVRNSLQNLIGDADETAGASHGVAESVHELSETLSSQEVKQGFAIIIDGLVKVAGFAAKAASAFAGFGSSVFDFFRDNENKSYLGLLQERMRLDQKRTDLQNNPISGRLGWNKGEIADIDREIAKLDKLIVARNAAAKKKPEEDKPAALPTTTVYGTKVDPKAAKAAQKAAAAAAKAAADAEAEAAQKAAAAHDQQIQSLISLQAALDPTTKIWADYNAEVEKQNGLAAVQAARAGANVQAINALRDANIALAAQQRDAALAAAQQADTQKRLSDAMGAMPRYAGVDGAVGGPAGELIKAVRAGKELEEWHTKSIAENQGYYDNLLRIEKAYNAEKAALDEAKGRLAVDTAVEGFGALAEATRNAYGEQSRQYRVAFALQKAAALAQAILSIQTSIARSSEIGFPWNIVTIAAAVAQGVSVLANIRSASFDVGGYTGPGGVKQPAGVVHKGEVVWSQRDIARAGGVATVEAMRLGKRGYADGGLVSMAHPLAGIPGPPLPASASLQLPASIANREAPSGATSVNNKMRVYIVQNEDQLAQRLAQHPAMEKAVVAIAGENGTAIRAEW